MISPTPWTVGVSVDKENGNWPVFRLRDMENADPDGEEVQSDRALMELAPDLLELSRDLLAVIDKDEHLKAMLNVGDVGMINEALMKARRTLSKVK